MLQLNYMREQEQHELILALKDHAAQLGRTPTRNEFTPVVVNGGRKIDTLFGTYTALVQAAGLETYDQRRRAKQIGNEVFEVPVARVLESNPTREMKERPPWPKLLTISDIHFPFANQKVITRFIERAHLVQPEYVILNGDGWDMFSHSRFPRSHNVFTPRDEEQAARAMNEEFWRKVKSACPTAKCIQTLGNHDIRPLKRILESYPSAEDWIATHMKQLFSYEGVQTIFDPREEIIIGDIAIFHGHRSKLGDHRDYTHMNCVNGHSHVGGVVFRQIQGMVLWELNSGLAGDPESKGLTYTPQRITHWTPGHAEIDESGPRFIPLR